MKKLQILFFLLNMSVVAQAQSYTNEYVISKDDIVSDYIPLKIWLKNYEKPTVSVEDISFIETDLPYDVKYSSFGNPEIQIGMERKRPFALIRVPAYSSNASGKTMQIKKFRLSLVENVQKSTLSTVAKKTTVDVTKSVLSSGTWYKIGITQTGFHKIDAAFISSMGLSPTTINPTHVRIFGNGGKMLSEANYVPRPTDLLENASLVYDGGDNTFNEGDYVIFYGSGPQGWDVDTVTRRFSHVKNIYSDTAYYFLTFDQGPGLRIKEQSATSVGNITVTDFNYYDVHDIDLVNDAGIGKIWFGEQFNPVAGNLSQTFNFDFGANVSNINCKLSLGATGNAGNSFGVSINSNTLGSVGFSTGTSDNLSMLIKEGDWSYQLNSTNASINLSFTPSSSSSKGYLNFIEINARRSLVINSAQLAFRDLNSMAVGSIANYVLQGATNDIRVWDVSNPQIPVALVGTLVGTTYNFSSDAQTLHEFAAMNSLNLYSPKYSGRVANQNLHGSTQVDNIIVTHSNFLSQAQKLAEYHQKRDNLRIMVTTPEQIYNEFSSGSQDISAIRDFVRMFYKRAGTDTLQMPRYLTLFGCASYDYKNRLANNSNFVPVFESAESSYNLSAFSTDDFYGFLDDNENIEEHAQLNTLDIGIGRLPARSTEDATQLVDKILTYKSPATLGPWRIASTLVADNNDGAGNFMQDTDGLGEVLSKTTHSLYNQSKIYLDAIPNISTPAGKRSPNANAAINERIYKGTMMINYIGHGNTQVWTEERILTQEDFSKWTNAKMLPFMITATCDFGQFDHPQYVSAGEKLVLQKGGGVISILTTTAAVYNNYNVPMNTIFLTTQFTQKADGKWNSFGDATRMCKNSTYAISANPSELVNYRKFALLGDPALNPNFPEYFIQVDSIIDVAKNVLTSSIKALGAYRITGRVHDNNGTTLNGFNGIMSVSLYDKPRVVSTISGINATFKIQDNLVYRGRVNVTNGLFSYTFITPKDINYYLGNGKMSNYAHNGITDAAGVDTSIVVGGYSDNPILSDIPPIVRPYINDSMFQNGGITGTNTSLYVTFNSETGINVSGNKIGHDLTAILDNDLEAPFILNDYYETAANTYQYGTLKFPINGIPNGKHTIKVKAWDVNNNSGEGFVDFVVLDGKIMGVENLMNYPNPFNNQTNFVFEHNHPEEALDVKISIYNTVGTPVRTIIQNFTPTGSRSSEINWDGTDNHGLKLPSGMYVYKIEIATEQGYRSTACQKLVILR